MDKQVIAQKSWIAYFRLCVVRSIIVLLVSVVVLVATGSGPVAAVVGLAGIAWTALGIAHLKSFSLYLDDDGIWTFQGVLPWSKGVNGIKWRDIGGALYGTGLTSWATKSSTVTVEHRFTKTSSIVVNDVARAPAVVATIAEILSTHRS